jgi:hypothetical protein
MPDRTARALAMYAHGEQKGQSVRGRLVEICAAGDF